MSLQRFGVAAIGLEPCQSGRQLEQQRDQLPDGEPQQQQQPDEQQQQPRVPLGPAPSSSERRTAFRLTRPLSRPAPRTERGQTETANRPVQVGKRSFPKAPGGLWASEAPLRPGGHQLDRPPFPVQLPSSPYLFLTRPGTVNRRGFIGRLCGEWGRNQLSVISHPTSRSRQQKPVVPQENDIFDTWYG